MLSANGYSSNRPVADNLTQAGRDLNRRIEIRLFFSGTHGSARKQREGSRDEGERRLAWFLRRYRDRALPDWRMRQVLSGSSIASSRTTARCVRRWTSSGARPRSVWIGFDTASDRALQWLGENRFDLALAEIQRAEQELAELRRCVTVAVDWQRTSAALAGVEDLLSPELESQPTVRVLQRLRDLARSLLDQGETRKARFVVFLLAEQIRALLARRPGELTAGFERMLGDLEAQDEAAVAHLRKLGREGYHRLAERLAEDLAAELAVTDRARRSSLGGRLSRRDRKRSGRGAAAGAGGPGDLDAVARKQLVRQTEDDNG